MIPLVSRGISPDLVNCQQTINTNPWRVLEKTVRTADEEKVKDCKEDVDTLLVFAGLYSAILTAFLIESYKTLQADPTQNLLQQIASQTSSYSFSNGYLNATFPTSQPSFQASTAAIRVNVCWFASLGLSLSSASFGILVKQWLREFLAISYINPQERIRIRDARIQGLEDWKLFEIASFLPVLLQISLALFFVGLCFFTAAVHPSIGVTSLFLVCCWAFLFSLSVVAPLVSPRCPYKTTLLKDLFRRARLHTRPWMQSLSHIVLMGSSLLQRGWVDLIHAITPIGRLAISRFHRTMSQIQKRPLASRKDTDEGRDPIPLVHPCVAGFSAFDDYMDLRVLDRLFSLYHSNPDAVMISEEEDQIRSAENHDLSIFENIDSSFLDDGLLSNMREALKLRPRSSNDTLHFVLAILRGRLGSYLPGQSSINQAAWPWTLACSTRSMLCDILADSLYYELHDHPNLDWKALSEQDSEWSGSFIFMIGLVPPRGAIPSSVGFLLQAIIDYSREHEGWSPMDVFSYQIRVVTRYHHDWPVRSMLFLSQTLKTLEAEVAEKCLQYIAHTAFVARTGPVQKIYDYLLTELEHPFVRANDIVAPTPQILAVLLELGGIILHNYTVEQAQNQEKPTTLSSSMRDLLNFVLTAVSKFQNLLPNFTLRTPLTSVSGGTELASALADLFVTPPLTYPLLSFFITRSHFLVPSFTTDGSNSFPELVRRVRLSHGENLLVLSACTSFFEDKRILLQRLARSILLRLAYLAYMLPTDVDTESTTHWHRMFSAIVACIEQNASDGPRVHVPRCQEQHDSTCESAFALLHEIHNCDDHHEPEEGHVESVIAQSQVPDEMVEILSHSVCSRHALDRITGTKFWRIKRVEKMKYRPLGATVEVETKTIHAANDEQTEGPLHLPLSHASPSSNTADVVPIPISGPIISTSDGDDQTTIVFT